MSILIRNIELKDIDAVKAFTDQWISDNYYSKEVLRKILLLGVQDNLNASFMALDGNKIIAVRITLAPYEWIKMEHLSPYINSHMWKVPYKKTAYFQSLFVDKNYQNKGIGSELTKRSMEVLMQMGCMGIVCHSWIESTDGSSEKYLIKLGFEPVYAHKNFWYFKNYKCIKCQPAPCSCTAQEMIYYFPLQSE